MSKAKSPKPPKAPDYVEAAQVQGRENRKTAQQSAQLSNPNVVGPGGSQTVTWNGNTPTVTQTLSEDNQRLYDQGNQLRIGASNAGMAGRGNLYDTYSQGFSYDGPDRVTNVQGGNIQTGINYNRPIQQNLGQINSPNIDDTTRQRVEDSLYSRSTSRLDPQFQEREDQLRTRLANQGIVQGSEAYDREMRKFDNSRTDAYAGARADAISRGGEEQSRMFGMNQAGRQQSLNENLAYGNFSNQAQQQGFNQGLASGQFGNEAQNQYFNQQLANANLNNQQRQQGLNESLQLRQLPMQEYSQLMGMSQGDMPQFQQYQGTQFSPGDYQQAYQNKGDYRADLYNAQAAGASNYQQGLFGLGSSLLNFFGK